MVKTRKRSRRPSFTRKRSRRIGGKEASPHELIKEIAFVSAVLEQKHDDSEVFDRMKDSFYQDTIPQMKASDWYNVLVESHTRPGLVSPPRPEDIKKRIKDAHIVMRFWVQQRRLKAENKGSGFQRLFRPEERSKKLESAVKEFKEFFRFLKDYSKTNKIATGPNADYYKEMVEEEKNILMMFGVNNSNYNKYGAHFIR